MSNNVEAAINWGNGKVYFFSGSQYIRYDIPSGQQDQPAGSISSGWPTLSFTDGIDGIVNWGNGKAYFFSGSQYVEYDMYNDKQIGNPKSVAQDFGLKF